MRIDGVNLPVIEIMCNRGNYGGSRPLSEIRYIVIHYTANKWDSAQSNLNYFKNNVVKASANYFVDSKQIGVSVPDGYYAWHCGGGLQGNGGHKWFGKVSNWNSIGIEICDDVNDGRVQPTQKALENAQMLTAALMEKYHIPIENVIRHWDVTGKICPAYFVGDENTETGKAWIRWKEGIEVVEKSRMIVNGKEVPVERILKNGTNYVKIRDVAAALDLKVGFKGSIATLDSNK